MLVFSIPSYYFFSDVQEPSLSLDAIPDPITSNDKRMKR